MGRKLSREKSEGNKIREVIKEPIRREKRTVSSKELIPSGSVMLNLACSDTIYGAFQIGRMINPIGDKSSGKSFLCWAMLAEMANSKRFKDYDLHYRDYEAGLAFDIEYLFGGKTKQRVNLGEIETGEIEEAYGDVLRIINNKEGKPFIYIIDSWDALTSKAEKERAAIYEAGKDPDGTYGTEKARMGGQIFRVISRDVKKKEGLVVIVSQVRANIGFGAQFKPKTRTGGYWLDHYASHTWWLSIIRREKKKKRTIGVFTENRVEKNRLTGKERTVKFPIFYDYGVDDIRACIDFLIEEEYWEQKGKTVKKIDAKEFGKDLTMQKLISKIEGEGRQQELFEATGQVWNEIEESLRLNRRNKY